MQARTYVLAFEVLDNLPHDKVQRSDATAPWLEAWVHAGDPDRAVSNSASASSSRLPQHMNAAHSIAPLHTREGSVQHATAMAWYESFASLQDPVIRRCLAAAEWPAPPDTAAKQTVSRPGALSAVNRVLNALAGVASTTQAGDQDSGRQTLYLPTGAMQMMEALHAACPRHHLIAADFSWFPAAEMRLEGVNAPIVSRVVRTSHGKGRMACTRPRPCACVQPHAQRTLAVHVHQRLRFPHWHARGALF